MAAGNHPQTERGSSWWMPTGVPAEGRPGRLEAIDRLLAEAPRRFQDQYEERRRREYNYPFLSQEFVDQVNTGRPMDPVAWQESSAADRLLTEQSDRLADALERTGVRARGDNNVVALGLVTGCVENLNAHRPIRLFPKVAQRERRPMQNELRYFRHQHKRHGKYMRYAVVTNGPTFPIGGLPPATADGQPLPKEHSYFAARRRFQDLGRTVSRFADWARTEWDIDVVFRGTEFTIKERDGDGVLSIHPHANLLYTPRRYLRAREWDRFLKEAADQLDGYWWKDNGALVDPNEAIKYQFKPAELDGLGDANIRWLFEQTFGLKMMQPMGEFQEWRNETLFEYSENPDTGCQVKGRKSRKVVTVEFPGRRELNICTVRKRAALAGASTDVEPRDSEPRENVVMTFTRPQRRFSPYSESCALVMNFNPDAIDQATPETLDEGLYELAVARKQARVFWDMNGAPDPAVALAVGRGQAAAREGEAGRVAAFSVHTRSSTAGKNTGRAPPKRINSNADPGSDQLSVESKAG